MSIYQEVGKAVRHAFSRGLPAFVSELFASDWALAVAAFLLLPNLALFVFVGEFHSVRAAVNIDFLFLGAAAIYLRRGIAVAAFLLLAALDLTIVMGRVYFLEFAELLSNIAYVSHARASLEQLPLGYIFTFLACTAGGAVLAGKFAGSGKRPVALCLVAVALLLAALDYLNGSAGNIVLGQRRFANGIYFVRANIMTSGVVSVYVSEVLYRRNKVDGWHAEPSATQVALGVRDGHFSDIHLPGNLQNVVLVVVESWGISAGDPAFDAQVIEPLTSRGVKSRYDVRSGTVPFHGATARGEFRELCGVNSDYRMLNGERGAGCLPAVLARRGFQTVGIHGFYGGMYARRDWWPQVGFEVVKFRESAPANVRTCGAAFSGLCDADTIAMLTRTLNQTGRHFGYVLTLNSHLPLSIATDEERQRHCRPYFGPTPCSLEIAWSKVFDAVAAAAMQLKGPTTFIIVGDHAPPILDGGNGFFRRNVVPYIILAPLAGKGALPHGAGPGN